MRLMLFSHRRRARARVIAGMVTLGVASLSACATHRHDPPQCQGPFTPINASSADLKYGAKR